ncbi:uncharacterized protein LOC107774085 [Nicotiana tabacum]|uniref:F-box/LRR-repeat protein 3-like n=2 Tax=Nicotiana TaxID=4085 RepID=A0A1S3YAL5_TOBAC|nr:PREDICTED: F-box/LRR-repeat protein 3-like [Nicotiana sylvestris]XP_016449037.1 PREDICTED: F-box/LRR-repeat protein 3-like [Nicotiana tabacum]
MAINCKDLPEECWELIFNRLHHQSDVESFSSVSKQFLALTNRLRLHLSVIDSTLLIHGTIAKLIRRFPNLKSIDLSNFRGELDHVLVDLANSVSYTSNLEQLDISNQKQLPVKGLKELGRKLKDLRVLKCSDLALLRDPDLCAIAQSFPFLEELDISYPRTKFDFSLMNRIDGDLIVTDSGIAVLSVNLANLRKINVSGNHFITDNSLVTLSMNCLNLQGIELEHCTLITVNGILSMLRTCAALNWISVSEIHIPRSSPGFECLVACSRTLQTLDVSSSTISDEFLFLVAKASLPLSRLSLCECTNFTLSGISSLLCSYQSLKFLSLVQVHFLTDETMKDLSQYLQSLVTINLRECLKLTISTFFTLARNCPSLETVNMENTCLGMTNSFHNGVKNTRIRAVILANNLYLDDDSLAKVALACPNLEMLDVSSCRNLTEAGIASVLEVCIQMRDLRLDHCSMITHIGQGTELPNLEVINAAGSALSDKGLAIIGSRCSRLLKLNLENCKGVTADGIHALVKNCKSLREINLKNCPQVSISSLNSMVFSSSSLRRVIPPCCSAFSDSLRGFYLHHGCLVSSG